MFRKKLLVAGVAAAMTVATGMTAYALRVWERTITL